jgi:hypothetical protein
MRRAAAIALLALAFYGLGRAQDQLPTFKSEAVSAFVWGERNDREALSSRTLDPVTGHELYTLSHGGVEVISRTGYETLGDGKAGALLNVITTIVNNTQTPLSMRLGEASVDGYAAKPLPVVSTANGLSKQRRKQVWELQKMSCFTNGFLSGQFFSQDPSQRFDVAPQDALTVSFVTKDPRHYSLRCSKEGCFPTGKLRFSVTVNTTAFVFVWPGRTAVYCGR